MAQGQAPADPPAWSSGYTFVVRLGSDTTAVEYVNRGADSLKAQLTTDRGTIRYRSYFAPDETVKRIEIDVYPNGMPLDAPTPM